MKKYFPYINNNKAKNKSLCTPAFFKITNNNE